MDNVGVYPDCEEDEFQNQLEELNYIGISPFYHGRETNNRYANPLVSPSKHKPQSFNIQGKERLRGNYSDNSSIQKRNGSKIFWSLKLAERQSIDLRL